jgi:endonuclease YncB( thermonuclease family)
MPNVCFAFAPETRKAASRKLIRASDGDTPVIEQPIRAVSCDTPEKGGYAGNPPISQPKLDRCRQRLTSGFFPTLPAGLVTYLANKITNDAAQRHIGAALRASQEFDLLLETRLTKPNGAKRSLAVIPTGEIIDTYSRMLAYFAPWFANNAADPLPPPNHPDRETFNLSMIKNGWAASFPVYPSLPKPADMTLLADAAEAAWTAKLGAWLEFGANVLLGYEYRMCIKLAGKGTQEDVPADLVASAFQRVCVDLRDCKILGELDFWKTDPPYRLWVWKKDMAEATAELGLHP